MFINTCPSATMSRLRLQRYTMTFAIANVMDKQYAALLTQIPVLQMKLINLRNRPLSSYFLKSMSKTMPSLYHNLVTGWKQFPVTECVGAFISRLEASPFPVSEQSRKENTKPTSPLLAPAGMMVPAAGSEPTPSDLMTPVLAEKMELGPLMADHRNCVRLMQFEGHCFIRVISPVYTTDHSELTNCWRVTDYSTHGNIIMSVLCRFTERCLPNRQTQTEGRKRGRDEGSDSSNSLQPPPKKQMRV